MCDGALTLLPTTSRTCTHILVQAKFVMQYLVRHGVASHDISTMPAHDAGAWIGYSTAERRPDTRTAAPRWPSAPGQTSWCGTRRTAASAPRCGPAARGAAYLDADLEYDPAAISTSCTCAPTSPSIANPGSSSTDVPTLCGLRT